MRSIGPWLKLDDNEPLRMEDAIECDCESGSHELSNAMADDLNKNFPTILVMARLIEAERDRMREALLAIRDLDFLGNRDPSYYIAKRALETKT